ncbi:MAG TPA: hypothetical protein VMB79_07405 [Jatrophihabitans sp.]|nr:hypothetical protein [Jatrophihabitans sp.]
MLQALLSVGREPSAADVAGMSSHRTAANPAEVDTALAELDGRRLVIDAVDVAGLSLVLGRMLRAGLLAETETAVLLERPEPYLAGLGLPAGRAQQRELARAGRPRLVGIVKDDSGGVCVTGATLTPWTPGDGWWVRAVVDDQRLCDGNARRLTVRRLGPAALEAEVRIGRWRTRRCRGRALQLACDPAQIVADGIPREGPRAKRTFWSEPKLWQLALPE